MTKKEVWQTFNAAQRNGESETAYFSWLGIWRSSPNISYAQISSNRPAPTSVRQNIWRETTEDKDYLGEITRLRGRLWQAEGHHEQARFCFDRAIDLSREQGARLFELNAARDLARLGIETGDSSELLDRLRSLVDWFPSLLDVPVLAECRALLR